MFDNPADYYKVSALERNQQDVHQISVGDRKCVSP
jgi:hypothetical protein